ncbi:MAG: hypothetical protein PHX08_08190 [Lachnospiraceae bacterium]|nr:hypothetical protein [Lachnospiraceae bacterium]
MKKRYCIIPEEVMANNKLSSGTKCFYGLLTSVCDEDMACRKTNQFYADVYGVATYTVTKWINELTEHGYVISTGLGNKREIHILNQEKMKKLIFGR